MQLTCTKCGAAVQPGAPTRACGHDQAPIAAHLQATAYGEGHSSVGGGWHVLRDVFMKIFRAVAG